MRCRAVSPWVGYSSLASPCAVIGVPGLAPLAGTAAEPMPSVVARGMCVYARNPATRPRLRAGLMALHVGCSV